MYYVSVSIFVQILFVLSISWTIIGCNEDPLKDDYKRAQRLFEKEYYLEAATKFREIADQDPGSIWAPKGLFQSGTINYLYLGRYDKAIDDFANLIYYYPEDKMAFEAQVNIIEIYMNKMDDYKQAIVELRGLIETYPEHRDMDQYHYMLARCYYDMRDFDQTRLEYLILLDSYPKTELRPQIYYDIANTYFVEGTGKLDKAIEYYQKVIDEFPDSPLVTEAAFYIAASLEEKGNLKEALTIYYDLLDTYSNPKVVKRRIEGIEETLEKMVAPASEEAYEGLITPKEEKGEKGEDMGDEEESEGEKGPEEEGVESEEIEESEDGRMEVIIE